MRSVPRHAVLLAVASVAAACAGACTSFSEQAPERVADGGAGRNEGGGDAGSEDASADAANRVFVTETWTGATGGVWPPTFELSGDLGLVRVPSIKDGRGYIVPNDMPLTADSKVIARARSVTALDVDQTLLVNMSSNCPRFALFARGGTDPSNNATLGYMVYVESSQTEIHLVKVVDGKTTELATGPTHVFATIDLRLHFVVRTAGEATELKASVWAADAAEPPAFDVATVDAEPRLHGKAGSFGLIFGLCQNRSFAVDDYAATGTR